MSMEEEEPVISEYTAKYCWKQNPDREYPKSKTDEYEALIQAKMNDDYKSSTNSKENEITDPYELLVLHKMAGDYESQSQIDIQKPLDDESQIEEPKEEYIQNEDNEQESEFHVEDQCYEEQPQEKPKTPQKRAPKTTQQFQKPPSRPASRNTSKAKVANRIPQDNRRPEERVVQQQNTPKKKKGTSFLSSSVNNTIKPKVTVYKPQFYAHPESAPPEEQQNLHGPFWVYWPRDEVIPAKYGGLRKLIRKK